MKEYNIPTIQARESMDFPCLDGRFVIFSLIVIPQTDTLDNKPKYDIGRGIYMLSLVHTTNIYFVGQETLTVPQSVGQSEFAAPKVQDSKGIPPCIVNLTT